MPTNAIKKQLHLYFGSNGTLLDKQGDLSANAQDDETFVINAYIEDGVVDNQTTLINFTPQDTMAYTSDWFAMFYRELVSYVVPTESEPRVFAKFSITVPSIILLVKSGKEQFTQRITIIQRYGNTHLGNFETLAQLNVDFPPTQVLDENNDVAFVYSNEVGQSNQVGFYQVEYIEGNYVWVKKEIILYNLATKQFNFLGLTVNVGFSNPRGVPTVAQSTIYQLMQELNSQAVRLQIVEDDLQIAQNDIVDLQDQIDEIADGTTDIAFDNAGTDLNSTFVEEAIKEVNDKANANEQNIVDMKDGTDAFTEVAIGVAPNVAKIRYIHTNGNNYQVLQIEYPDGRKEEINETIPVNYRNESGVSLSSGRLLMTDGTSQGNQAIKGILFDPTSPNAYKILGVVTVDGVAVNQKSKATRFGIVHSIPTSEFASSGTAYAEGQYLWGVADGRLSNVAPTKQAISPTKPSLRVQVGIIINLQGGNADVLVAPIIYQKLSDSSDVQIGITESGTMLGNANILRYQTSTQTWVNSNALTVAESEINNIKNGTTTVKKAEQDKNGNDIVNTYETKVIVSGIDSRVTNLENANMVKSVSYQPMTHIITFTFYDNTTQSLDLPLESAIIGASYDNVTKDITFTLQNGSTLVVPLDDLVSGLASETWVTTNFIPKTALKTAFSATPLDTNVISEKLAKDSLDLKEDLANKKSIINNSEIEYPNSKAILNIGLDTPIKDLDGKTLREVYFYGNLSNGATWSGASPVVVNGNEIVRTIPTGAPTLQSYRMTSTIPINNGNTYYLNYETKYTATLDVFYFLRVSNLWGFASPTQEYQVIEDIFTNSGAYQVIFFDFLNNLTTSDEVKLYLRNVLVLNLTALNFTNKSREVLDFWWNVYKQITSSSISNLTLNDINKLSQFLEQKNKYFLTSPINGLFEHIDRTYVDYSSNYTTLQHTAIYDLYDALIIGNEDYISYEVVDTITVGEVQKEIRKYILKPVQPMGSLNKIPKIIIVAAQHGSEKMSAITTYNMVYDIINHWKESELLAFLRFNVEFIIFPVLNVSGFDTNERQNYNGVDLNRNYPIGWYSQGSGTVTYSGPYALSEKETQAVSETVNNNKDSIMLIDFHNFFTPSYESTDSIWVSTTSIKGQLIGTNFIRTMTSFFRRKYSNVEDVQNIGYVSGGYRARGGYLDVYGDYNGMNGETLEVGYKFNGIVGTVPFDIVSQKLNEETFVNYILQKLRVLING